MQNDKTRYDNDDKPPLFKTWKAWYAVVIVFLLLLIILFYYLTRKFS